MPVARRVREAQGANDALKAAHSGVACQWQLVEINSAARALGGRRGTASGTHWQAGAGGPGTCAGAGPGTTGPRTAGAQDSRQTYTDSEMPDGGGYGSPNSDPGTKCAILNLKLCNYCKTILQNYFKFAQYFNKIVQFDV